MRIALGVDRAGFTLEQELHDKPIRVLLETEFDGGRHTCRVATTDMEKPAADRAAG